MKNLIIISLLLVGLSGFGQNEKNISSQKIVDKDEYKYLKDLISKLEWKNDFDYHVGIPSAIKDSSLQSGKYYWANNKSGFLIKINYKKKDNTIEYQIHDTVLVNYKKVYEYRVGTVKNKMLIHAEAYMDGEIWHFNSYKYPSKEIPRIIMVENDEGGFNRTEEGKMLKLIPKGLQIQNGEGHTLIEDCINDSICINKNYYNGNLESEGEYKNNRKSGVWKYYDDNRELIREEVYEKGNLLKD